MILITIVLVFSPEPQLQVNISPALNPIDISVSPSYVEVPIIKSPETYPVGTNKVLFVSFDTIPKLPEPESGKNVPPVPKLDGNVVTPLYALKLIDPVGPTIQSPFDTSDTARPLGLPPDVKPLKLNEPEPDHTTLGPVTCEMVILKSPVTPDVGVTVGVGVFVGVSVGVSVIVGVGVFVGVSVIVGVGVLVGVSVIVGVGVLVGVSVIVGVGVLVGVSVIVGVGVLVGVSVIVGVGVSVFVGVGVLVGVSVLVGVGVFVGVSVTVGVGVFVGVSVGVSVVVGVGVAVLVGVLVGVGVGNGIGVNGSKVELVTPLLFTTVKLLVEVSVKNPPPKLVFNNTWVCPDVIAADGLPLTFAD
jgi:hypothetical protein